MLSDVKGQVRTCVILPPVFRPLPQSCAAAKASGKSEGERPLQELRASILSHPETPGRQRVQQLVLAATGPSSQSRRCSRLSTAICLS